MIDGKAIAADISNNWDNAWAKFDCGVNKGRQKSILGNVFEDLIMDYVKRNISNNLNFGKGLIKYKNRLSPQIDIIIFKGDGLYKAKYSSTVVVESKNVRTVFEVKSYVDKPGIANVNSQIAHIEECCPEAKTVIFIGNLATPINANEIKVKLKADYFAILYRNVKGYKDTFDYGNGIGNLTKYLKSL